MPQNPLKEVHPQDYPLKLFCVISVIAEGPWSSQGCKEGKRGCCQLWLEHEGLCSDLVMKEDFLRPVQLGKDCHKPAPLTKSFHKRLMRSGHLWVLPSVDNPLLARKVVPAPLPAKA